MMDGTYLRLAEFAQQWGLAYFMTVFLAVLIFALRPSRRQIYDKAAHVPLRED